MSQARLAWGKQPDLSAPRSSQDAVDLGVNDESVRPLLIGASRFSEGRRKLLQSRGMPGALFGLASIDLSRSTRVITVPERDGTGSYPIGPSRQVEGFRATLNDTSGNWTFCISGKSHVRRAQVAAMALFCAAAGAIKPGSGSTLTLPWWHRIIGGYRDPLRDGDENLRMRVGRPNLLVLDGVPADADRDKITKLYDLLEQFSDVPRVVITGGDCPLHFMHERVRLPVNRVLYLHDADIGII